MRASLNPSHRRILLVLAIISATAVITLWAQQARSQPDLYVQNPPRQAADIEVVPIQLRPGVGAFVLVDKTHQTICVYQYQLFQPAHERLALLAVRSFEHDVKLRDYNTAEPHPGEVRQLLEEFGPTLPRPKEKPENTPVAPEKPTN